MRRMTLRGFRYLLVVWAALAASAAGAQQLITNGGFENNGGVGTSVFAGWTVFTQASSQGSLSVQTGTASPVTASTVEAPPAGSFAAMTDMTGPGAYALYQDITIPAGATATFSARIYIRNTAAFASPASLDYTTPTNQQFRIDVMNPAAAIQDVGAGVLLNIFQTDPGDPAVQSYQTVTADLSSFAGQTVRIRFAETDNQGVINVGIDQVSVAAAVAGPPAPIPTLSEWGLIILVLLMAAAFPLAGRIGRR